MYLMQEEQLSWHFDVNSSYVKHMKTRTRLTKSEKPGYCICKQSQWCTFTYELRRINIIMKLNRYEKKIIKGIVESRKESIYETFKRDRLSYKAVKNMTLNSIFVYEKIDICRSNKRVRI